MNTTESLRNRSANQLSIKNRSLPQIKVAFCLAAALAGWVAGAGAQTNARVIAWGSNDYNRTNVPAGLSNVIAIAAGNYHSLALKSDHSVVAWGAGAPGQQNSFADQGQSTVPGNLNGITAVAGGYYHSLALKSNGTVVAWGAGEPGETLNPNYGQSTVPAKLNGVRAIAAGGFHSLALKSNGTVVAWGLNTSDRTNVPAGLSDVIAIAGGGSHSLALTSDGTVVAWGYNGSGQCVVPAGLSNVIAIAAGDAHSLALKSDLTVVAWGSNSYGQTNVPAGLSSVIAIVGGGSHSLALMSDHTVVAWGAGGPGQTGSPHYGQSTVPASLFGVMAIAAGGDHSMALIGRPMIESPPVSQTATVSSTVEFQVEVSGATPLAYQWFLNATNLLSGATSTRLQLTNLLLSQSGAYSVVFTNEFGSATSSAALLAVTAVPVIVVSPTNQKTLIGGTADFSVAVEGTLPLAYQWFFGTNAILGATDSALQLTNVQPWQAGVYTVVVTNAYGAATSVPAVVEVFPPGTVLTASEADLRAALAASPTVTFACDGTVLLASTVTNTSDTTLDASGHQITITANTGVRVFQVNSNVSFTVVNLTIAGANSVGGSAILNFGGTVNLTGVLFSGNTATPNGSLDQMIPQASGGAIFNRGGTVNASNCSFVGNSAQTPVAYSSVFHEQVYGGAIRNESGQVDLRSCAFVSNRASGGASVQGGFDPGTGDPGKGGAIYNSGTMTLDLCTLAGNSATGGGGLGDLNGSAGFSASEGSGGAIFNQGTLTVDRTTLCGNTATGGSGGGGGADGNTPPNGYAGGNGGGASGAAICNLGSLWLTRSTLVSNVVTGGTGGAGRGGGQFMTEYGGNGGSGGNGSSGLGGALFNGGGASLVNCTLAFNTGSGGAGGGGGAGALGIHWGGSGGSGGNGGTGFGGVDGTCNLTNCTVAWNRGNAGGGGAGGTGGASVERPGVPGANGTSGSAWGGTACGTLVNTLIASNTPAGGDSFPDPKLGPLADNGGPTLTMALLPGSPAIDAGNSSVAPATDQRGVPRPFSLAADIGAFEFWPTLLASPTGSGGIEILASGISGQTCRLLASSNFLNWMPLATNQIGSDGTTLFYDSCPPGSACRYYRLVTP